MKTPKKPAEKPEAEEPRVFTADIYVSKNLVSSVHLNAANRTAAMLAVNKMINVQVR